MKILKYLNTYCLVEYLNNGFFLSLDYRFAIQSEWTSGPGFGSERHSTWSGHGNTFL